MRLLIAEDDLDLAEVLTVFLEKNRFLVDTVHDGQSACEYAAAGVYDAIILDVMMPRMNGIEVLKKLRLEGCKLPIMMLTAKAQTGDRIIGFDAGADDYLPKPFDPAELISRVRAMLRRTEEYTPARLSYGDIELDTEGAVMYCNSQSVHLSEREFQVLELFMRSPKIVFSADKIMERVWGWDSEADVNVVWVHISNLRKKLQSIGSRVTVKATRGIGYMLEMCDD